MYDETKALFGLAMASNAVLGLDEDSLQNTEEILCK